LIRLRVKAIRRLHEHRPPRTRMICFDEWGSLELKPHGGTAWAAQRRPRRMRATYRGLHGARHFLGFYDVHGHVLGGVFRPRKRISDLLAAFGRLRRCYPTRRLVVVLDKLHDIHDHPRFLRGLRRRRITPVFTATNASWMNLIEAQYGALKRFAGMSRSLLN